MVLVNSRLVMEISDVARSEAETEPSGDFVATPSGVRTSLDDPEIKANPVGLSVTVRLILFTLREYFHSLHRFLQC